MNFWATWRPSSLAMITDLIALHNAHKKYRSVGNKCVDGLSSARKLVLNFVERYVMGYPIVLGDPMGVEQIS